MLKLYNKIASFLKSKKKATVFWFTNQQLANKYNISELIKSNKCQLDTLKSNSTEIDQLTKEKNALEDEYKNKTIMFNELKSSISVEKELHAEELTGLHDQYRKFIIQFCKERNIRSPFDKLPLREPIVQKGFFSFSKVKQTLFLEKLQTLGIRPNDEQLAMLFCENPAACIQAGAGSGKSTMLAARVAFLRLENDIPFSNITVTTFTKEARSEFIEKLVKNVQLLSNVPTSFGEKEARDVVRTFHALAYKVNKEFGDGKRIILGNWTPIFENKDGEIVDIENLGALSEKELKENYKKDTTIPRMSDLMQRIYEYLYTKDTKFKQKIDYLFRASIKQLCFNQKSPEKNPFYRATPLIEKSLSKQLFHDWLNIDLEKHRSIAQTYPPIDDYWSCGNSKQNTNLKYHIYLPKQKLRVFLSPDINIYDKVKKYDDFCDSKRSLSSWLFFRKLFVYYKADSKYIWVDSEEALMRLLEREKQFDEFPPEFSYACVGEFAKKPNEKDFIPVYGQFKSLSDFIYSLGKSISDFSSAESERLLCYVPNHDKVFLEACITFNGALEKLLEKENLISFEQIFHTFQNSEHPALKLCNAESLSWCKHLLIDEFQDISPNIIKFLNNLKAIYTTKTKSGSLMFVGDSNQSIYVWRGSSYLYIKMPDTFFPVPDYFSILPLKANYRSAKPVIELAKIPLVNIGSEDSVVPAREDLASMECNLSIKRPYTTKGRSETLDYDLLCKELQREVNRVKATPEDPVYVLFTRHSLAKDTGHKEWDSLFQSLKKSGEIKDLTIHTSKGLEARSVFILGDIAPNTWNPIKNAMYEWCEIGTTFENAQYHEANCLCYVAITRAKNNVHWYIDRLQDNGLARAYFEKWPSIVS
ncbi:MULTISPECIES: UvrD-helicase domain-containing protein [unclassified Pseudoalteromonas]|uniref:UvrD-helicase domain-containing protein n=1 Tax=unclassified Pseudoalteromonas TaxID=194690 RepID=UPI0025B3EE3A|nr:MULTISPECIES: UvrD-helicase domain-containing protein [unclassified Pseudoalteromonas]MDN3412941.1 UvrD-helicase domain-containing protein [Pseudoalteromonas sp. APC 3250]MDN3487240.1 UvrD-helicase domain-containing protein [Pseudoalteromonas sp. APC 3224]